MRDKAVVVHCYGFVDPERLDFEDYKKYLDAVSNWLGEHHTEIGLLIIAGGARNSQGRIECISVRNYLRNNNKDLFYKILYPHLTIWLDERSLTTPAIVCESQEIICKLLPKVKKVIHLCDNWRSKKIQYCIVKEKNKDKKWFWDEINFVVIGFSRGDITYKSSYWFQLLQILIYFIFPWEYTRDLNNKFKNPPN